jgi:two-component system OmpR family sensor kinase
VAGVRLHASTRVRLTAWYAALFVLVLVALGVSVDTLARTRLLADVDNRLLGTAQDIAAVIEQNLENWPFTTRAVSFEDIVPELGSFASRGLLVQIVEPKGAIVRSSEYAPTSPLVSSDAPRGDPEVISTTWRGDDLRAVDFPVTVTDQNGVRWYIGSVIVGERLTTMRETLGSLRQVLLVTSGLGLALALAGGWVLAGRALRPVDRVTAAAAAIAEGDGTATSLRSRLPVPPTNDELARLSSTFNAMLDRLEASFRAQERFVADASHELRTPLTAIRGNVDVLIRQVRGGRHVVDPGEVAVGLDDVRRESDRMRRLLDDLLLLARADAWSEAEQRVAHQDTPVFLDEIAAEGLQSAEPLTSGQVLQLEAPRSVPVKGDRDRLHQLVMILLDNAIRHTPPGRHIQVAVASAPDGSARLAVRDEGEGIAAEHLPHIFERFYRADGARGRSSGGTGLGLAIARAICLAHGGNIEVSSAPGQGTTFIATLPLARPGETRDVLRGDQTAPADGSDYSTKRTMIAPRTPTMSTNAIGKINPATDSLRNPRP